MTDRKVQSVVPRNVYDFIERVRKKKPALMTSLAEMVKLAREEKEPEVARWIKLNSISYGVGYWNGFIPDDAIVEQTEPAGEPTTKEGQSERRRKRIPPQEEIEND